MTSPAELQSTQPETQNASRSEVIFITPAQEAF